MNFFDNFPVRPGAYRINAGGQNNEEDLEDSRSFTSQERLTADNEIVQEDSIQKSGKLKTSSKSSSKQDRTSGPDLIDFSSDIMDVFATSTTTSTSSSNSLGNCDWPQQIEK